jgi:hypothetical protein
MKSLPKRLLPLLSLPLLLSADPPDLQTVAAKNPKLPEAAAVLPEPKPEWTVGAGVQWRQIGQASFRGGRQAGQSHLPAAPRSSGGISTGYTNGFVSPDSTGGSQTWNWGYSSAAQVNGDLLTLSGTSGQVTSRTVASSYSTDWSDDLASPGIYLLLESPELAKWQHLSLSAALGYSYAQDDTTQESLAFRSVRTSFQRTRSVTDVYDIPAIAPPPTAPYSGSFNGPGPVISRTPVRRLGGGVRERDLGSDIFTSHLRQSLEVQLHTLSFGPRMGLEIGSLRLLAGLGFALNIVLWDADSRETLRSDRHGTLRTWRDTANGTDVLPGVFAELGAEWRFTKSWSLATGLRYDWSQPLEGRIGNAAFEVDLGGWTAQVGLAFHF